MWQHLTGRWQHSYRVTVIVVKKRKKKKGKHGVSCRLSTLSAQLLTQSKFSLPASSVCVLSPPVNPAVLKAVLLWNHWQSPARSLLSSAKLTARLNTQPESVELVVAPGPTLKDCQQVAFIGCDLWKDLGRTGPRHSFFFLKRPFMRTSAPLLGSAGVTVNPAGHFLNWVLLIRHCKFTSNTMAANWKHAFIFLLFFFFKYIACHLTGDTPLSLNSPLPGVMVCSHLARNILRKKKTIGQKLE